MSKITIRFGNNAVEFEGSEEFIRDELLSIVERFREVKFAGSHAEEEVEEKSDRASPITKSRPKRQAQGSGDSSKVTQRAYKPKFNSSLDLSALEAFYDRYELKNHPEKILTFGIFLRDSVKKDPFTTDDVFSCYFTMKGKTSIPEAFAKALRDARSVGYIDFNDLTKVSVSVAGQNAFQKLKLAGKK